MPRGPASSARSVAVALVALLVAGTALLRGGVDLPVLAAAAAVAAAALALAPGRAERRGRRRLRDGGREDPRGEPGPAAGDVGVVGDVGGEGNGASEGRRPGVGLPVLVPGLLGVLGVILLQLVPLPPAVLAFLSPATADVLDGALAPLGLWPSWRPLSLAPAATALEAAKAAVLLCVVAAGAVLARSDRRRDALLRGLAASGVAVSAAYYGAALLGLSPLLAPQVTFVNTNHLAGFLLLAAWPSLGFALRARGAARAGWLVAFAFVASGVFLSLSRAGIAAFFVAAGVFAALRLRAGAAADPAADPAAASKGRARTPRPPARGAGAPVAAAGVAGALAIASWLAFEPVVAELGTIAREDTTGVKLGVVPAAAGIARDFPLLGIGRGAFATVYPAYKSDPAQATFTHVENEWLQLPVDLGLLPGLAAIALFAWAFLAAARRPDLSRPLAGALAGAAALAAQNLFDFSLELPGVAIPFALVLGIASRAMPRVHVRPLALRAAAALALAVAAAGLFAHAAHPLDAGLAAVQGAPAADEAAARARAHLSWHPADYAAPAAVGARLAAEDRCAEALPWLGRATLRNPTAPEPHRSAARCLARGGRHDEARRAYRLAHLHGDRTALAEAFLRYDGPGELLALAPETPAGLAEAARLLRDRPPEAAEAWRRAWDLFGEPRALASLAAATLSLGDAEEALRLSRLLQDRAPRAGAGYAVAARALDALGRPDGALAELERGASRLPGDAEVLAPLGARHLAARRWSLARASFDRIVAKEGPALTRKRVLVARALEGQGRLQEALREAQVAREITPGDPGAEETFARLAAALGRYDEAIEALEAAARSPAATPGAYDARIDALRLARETQRTRRLVQGAGR